jgi:uncharacterized Tic20 family protein
MPRITKKSKAARRVRLALLFLVFFALALAPMYLLVHIVAHLIAIVSIVPAIFLIILAAFLTPIVLVAGDLAAIRIFKFFMKGRKPQARTLAT